MNEDKLTNALRSLPRVRAASGFREAVVRRLDEPGPQRYRRRPLLYAIAVGGIGVLILVSVQLSNANQERQAARQRVESMRQEYWALERDLDDLRRIAVESRPVVGIEGDDLDFFIDLRSLAADRAAAWSAGTSPGSPAAVSARPVSYQRRDR
jgi:hypothetical protein